MSYLILAVMAFAAGAFVYREYSDKIEALIKRVGA